MEYKNNILKFAINEFGKLFERYKISRKHKMTSHKIDDKVKFFMPYKLLTKRYWFFLVRKFVRYDDKDVLYDFNFRVEYQKKRNFKTYNVFIHGININLTSVNDILFLGIDNNRSTIFNSNKDEIKYFPHIIEGSLLQNLNYKLSVSFAFIDIHKRKITITISVHNLENKLRIKKVLTVRPSEVLHSFKKDLMLGIITENEYVTIDVKFQDKHNKILCLELSINMFTNELHNKLLKNGMYVDFFIRHRSVGEYLKREIEEGNILKMPETSKLFFSSIKENLNKIILDTKVIRKKDGDLDAIFGISAFNVKFGIDKLDDTQGTAVSNIFTPVCECQAIDELDYCRNNNSVSCENHILHELDFSSKLPEFKKYIYTDSEFKKAEQEYEDPFINQIFLLRDVDKKCVVYDDISPVCFKDKTSLNEPLLLKKESGYILKHESYSVVNNKGYGYYDSSGLYDSEDGGYSS